MCCVCESPQYPIVPPFDLYIFTFSHFLYVFINYHNSYGKISKRDVICQLKKPHISNLFYTQTREREREGANKKNTHTHANTSQNIQFSTDTQFDLLEWFYVCQNGDGCTEKKTVAIFATLILFLVRKKHYWQKTINQKCIDILFKILISERERKLKIWKKNWLRLLQLW